MTTRRNVLRTFAGSPLILGAAPGDRLNIAAVGVGGMGANYIDGCRSENIVALVDVDDAYAAKTYAKYPKAKTYRDVRVMLDQEKSVDAVIIGTPDHSHSAIALAAMQTKKHLYCAKPLTNTIGEARRVVETARAAQIATQMSVQSCGSDASLNTVEWVRSGVIGPVSEVHVWSDRPVWPQAVARPNDTPVVPKGLDWKAWLGRAPERPYHPLYHPFNWRGWYDFGTGALGDMGCHTLHVIVQALELGLPSSVQASAGVMMEPALAGNADTKWTRSKKAVTPETYPSASIVTWEFRERNARVIWYDGGLKPARPSGLPRDQVMGADGILFRGSLGVILSKFTGTPYLVPSKANAGWQPPAKTLPRSTGHYAEWIAAAKGGKPAMCNFDFAGQLTEIALLGALAQRTGKYLEWDAEHMMVSNEPIYNRLLL